MKALIAIDPGVSGGVAIQLGETVEIHPMPATAKDLSDLIDAVHSEALLCATPIKAFLEEVGGYAGGAGAPGSAMFSFGEGYGEIKGILTHAKIPFETVRPQKWQAALSLGGTGRTRVPATATAEMRKSIKLANDRLKREWKNKLKKHAQQLHPSLNVTLKTADALLILEYARRHELSVSN